MGRCLRRWAKKDVVVHAVEACAGLRCRFGRATPSLSVHLQDFEPAFKVERLALLRLVARDLGQEVVEHHVAVRHDPGHCPKS